MGIEGMSFECLTCDICSICDHGVDHERRWVFGVDREIDQRKSDVVGRSCFTESSFEEGSACDLRCALRTTKEEEEVFSRHESLMERDSFHDSLAVGIFETLEEGEGVCSFDLSCHSVTNGETGSVGKEVFSSESDGRCCFCGRVENDWRKPVHVLWNPESGRDRRGDLR
jgi:hypothetical protein